jgi:hypothetical protein
MEQETFEGFTLEEKVLLRRLLLQVRENLERVSGERPPCYLSRARGSRRP